MILLDTNVISEVLRPTPAVPVRRWMTQQPREDLVTAAICEAELAFGVALLPPGLRRRALEEAISAIFDDVFIGRVLPFDRAAAAAYAEIRAARRRIGRPIDALDAQIAAIARIHGAAVATRNVDDFADCRIDVLDPWRD